MSDLTTRTPRSVRERRAYRLVVTGAVAGVVGTAGLLLAVFGVIGAGVPVVALLVAVACGLLFRRAVSAR